MGKAAQIKGIEPLQNAVNSIGFEGLEIKHHIQNDKRKKKETFVLLLHKSSISPILDYDKMNHFILGFSKAIKLNHKN